MGFVGSLKERLKNKTIELDSGRRVRVGKKIAEGGFSYVFRATDCKSRKLVYALKQIQCEENAAVHACQQEAEVHRRVAGDGKDGGGDGANNNVLPLLGLAFVEKSCFMLFPFMPHSLRDEVNRRIFDNHDGRDDNALPPWSELNALRIFRGILNGVQTMHRCGYSHRDIKLENILFGGPGDLSTPVLMDFGSVGPLTQPIELRKQVLNIAEIASSHTTMPYRPPELFDGGVQRGDPEVDFTRVDVWSLGCTLFGILYGASPFESEFNRQTGAIRIVDCSQLRVIGKLPQPPEDSAPTKWYSSQIKSLIEWMLVQDRLRRPSLDDVIARVDTHIASLDGDHLDVML